MASIHLKIITIWHNEIGYDLTGLHLEIMWIQVIMIKARGKRSPFVLHLKEALKNVHSQK